MKASKPIRIVLLILFFILSFILSVSPESILGNEPRFKAIAHKACFPDKATVEKHIEEVYNRIVAEREAEQAEAKRLLATELERLNENNPFGLDRTMRLPLDLRMKAQPINYKQIRKWAPLTANSERYYECQSYWRKTLKKVSNVGLILTLISLFVLIRMTWRMLWNSILSFARAIGHMIAEPFRRLQSKSEYNELLRLKDLKDKGILTEEEYLQRVNKVKRSS